MPKPKIISFATKDKRYLKYADNFRRNMDAIGADYDLEIIPPVPFVQPNERLINHQRRKKDTCRTRGKFILKKLEEYKRPLLWIDCDDYLSKPPCIPEINFDVGFCKPIVNVLFDISAGAILFNYTDNAKHFLKVWDYLNAWPELEPMGGDHIRLVTAKYICFDINKNNAMKFKQADISEYVNAYLKLSGNRS